MLCEALVLVVRTMGRRPYHRYVPCGRTDAQLHHKLTRARGGLILDQAGETYHQMWLCPEHHAAAHDKPAFDNGLLLRGFVTSDVRGMPVYSGPDEYLSSKYGKKVPAE